MIEDPPYYLLTVTAAGQPITERFATAQEAMTAAEGYQNPFGAILLCAPGREPVEVIVYRTDGSIEVGGGVPEDDENWIDAPWTEDEIAENFRRSSEWRAQRGG